MAAAYVFNGGLHLPARLLHEAWLPLLAKWVARDAFEKVDECLPRRSRVSTNARQQGQAPASHRMRVVGHEPVRVKVEHLSVQQRPERIVRAGRVNLHCAPYSLFSTAPPTLRLTQRAIPEASASTASAASSTAVPLALGRIALAPYTPAQTSANWPTCLQFARGLRIATRVAGDAAAQGGHDKGGGR